jgi:hypothetical protein
MFARVFSQCFGSLLSLGVLLLCTAMTTGQPPLLPAVEPPSSFYAVEPPTVTATPPVRPVTRAPATVAWLPEEGKAIVSLKDGSQIRGTLDGLTAIEISTGFGDLSIPAKMIERVTLNEDVNLSTIEYKRDRLTGVIELPTLGMTAAWGDVSIKQEQLKRFPLRETGSTPSGPYATTPAYAIPLTPYAPASSGSYPDSTVAPAATAIPAPEKFRVQLQDKSILVGHLPSPEKISIRLAFAEVEVPVKSISWLKRADGAVQVRLANGDRISGELMVDEWTIEGLLGTIRLDAAKVAYLRRGPGRQRWITRTVTEPTAGGGTVTRYVQELVEMFDEEPEPPATPWATPVLPSPAAIPIPPPDPYAP